MDTEALRHSYKPDRTRLLFVGESPPASGGFFYDKSTMTTYTAQAFEKAYNITFPNTANFLSFFKGKGCYLDDISTTPVDNLHGKDRKEVILNALDGFTNRLNVYNPEVIIVILKRIGQYVKSSVQEAGIESPVYVLPFPGMGWQNIYKRQLIEILNHYRDSDLNCLNNSRCGFELYPLERSVHMTVEENKLLIRRFIENVINTGNTDTIDTYVSKDYTEVFDGKRYPSGIEGAKEHIRGVRQTYPDLTLTVERQIGEGEWVATCITARGTHKGSWLGIKPTGKTVSYTGVNINRVIDGKIVEHGGAANLFGPLLEIGAIKIVGESV